MTVAGLTRLKSVEAMRRPGLCDTRLPASALVETIELA